MNNAGYIYLNIGHFIDNDYVVSIYYSDLINNNNSNQSNIEDL